MAAIRQDDFIQSVADAFQFISYYHPEDYIRDLAAAWRKEESPAAKDAMAQILINSRMAAEGHRPICQDTGIAIAFVRIGMNARFDATMTVGEMVNEGVRRAYTDPDNILRASVLSDPDGKRTNTKDNTPAVTHVEMVPGDKVEVIVAAKGGGSENKSKFAMLLPNDSIVDWVLSVVPTMGADWCPPGILSLGIGGTPEKAMLMAKWGMMDPIDMQALIARGPARPRRGTAAGAVRQGQRAGHRRAGPGRADDGARRQGQPSIRRTRRRSRSRCSRTARRRATRISCSTAAARRR